MRAIDTRLTSPSKANVIDFNRKAVISTWYVSASFEYGFGRIFLFSRNTIVDGALMQKSRLIEKTS